MAEVNVTKVEGFDQLNIQLKKLDDRTKRTEVNKILRRVAKPLEKAYSEELPSDNGVIRKSVAIRSVPKSKSGGNPSIYIRPVKKASADPYYKFMIIKKGDRPGSNSRGSRKGMNTVVEDARNRAIQNTGPQALKEARDKTADYIQKTIDKLSTK